MQIRLGWYGWVLLSIFLLLTGCSTEPRLEGHIIFETYRDGNAEIYQMETTGENLVNLSNHEAYDGTPSWGPEGLRIAFTSERTGNPEVFFMQENGEGVEQVTDGAGFNVVPAWSPDGKKILFSSNRTYYIPVDGGQFEIPANPKIWAIDIESNKVERLTSNLGLDMYGDWSPDGSEIVFMSIRDGNPEIYILRSGGVEENLTQSEALDLNPAWSPDGTKIAFMSDRDGNAEIYVMDLTKDYELTNLSNHPANEGDPDWSPDGKHIVFTSDRDGNLEIYIMRADGSNPRRLTENPADDIHPQWQPSS